MILPRYSSILLLALMLSACGGSSAAESTPIISSDQVLQTARAMADQTRGAMSPTITRAPASPTETQLHPTVTSTSNVTIVVSVLRVEIHANIRSGPGEEYEVIDGIFRGDIANVIGRYDDTPLGTWWFIRRSETGRRGWIWSGVVTLTGDVDQIPILVPPPILTPYPEPSISAAPTETVTISVTPTP